MLIHLAQIFNNEVDSYQTWTLFLIFVSISILISGVVLLTHKKPEPGAKSAASVPIALARPRGKKPKTATSSKADLHDDDDLDSSAHNDEEAVLWAVGDASDDEEASEDEDIDHHQHPLNQRRVDGGSKTTLTKPEMPGEEGAGLMKNVDTLDEDREDQDHRASLVARRRSSSNSTVQDPFRDDEFGDWTSGSAR